MQASEKLYKAAEEAVKAAAALLGLSDVLERVESRGRWTVTDLEQAVRALDKKVPEPGPGGTQRTTCTCGASTRLGST